MTKDKVVLNVIKDLNERSKIGVVKYKTTLDVSNMELTEWLQHAYEECLDQANYLKGALMLLKGEIHTKNEKGRCKGVSKHA